MVKVKKEQAKKSTSETAAYTVDDVASKINALDREVKYLLNKAKMWRPKKPKVTIIDNNGTKPDNSSEEKTPETTAETAEDAAGMSAAFGSDTTILLAATVHTV